VIQQQYLFTPQIEANPVSGKTHLLQKAEGTFQVPNQVAGSAESLE